MASSIIDAESARHLGIGAAVLSAGGGSFPYQEYLGTRELLAERGPVEMIPVDALADEARIALVAMVGAPLPMAERLADPAHFARPVEVLARHTGAPFDAVMGFEIGSMNGLIPVMVAALTGLPLVDADTVGRSFPEVDMSALSIAGLDLAPLAVSDIRANDIVIDRAADGHWVETILRALAGACGSVVAVCGVFTAGQIAAHAHLGTFSRALGIGRSLLAARAAHEDPVAALLAAEGGRAVAAGKVVDVERVTTDAFVRGHARIALAGGGEASVLFQNEYSVVEVAGRRTAMVPDLIAVLDSERGDPLGTEALRYGQHVTVVRFPPLPRHVTPEALAVLGPRAFGFDFDYRAPDDEVRA